MQIQVEVRSFISEEKYRCVLEFMETNAEFVEENEQTTYYFSGDVDFRVQRGRKKAKLWMKRGEVHDKHREETEVVFKREEFEKMLKIFQSLGYGIKVKWFRKRKEFDWEGTSVMLDHTTGYGHIIELERMSDEENKEKVYEDLKEKLESLGVDITPRSEFERKFKHYTENWKDLTKGQR
jgi:predicted adenylyl cyclase CyaB